MRARLVGALAAALALTVLPATADAVTRVEGSKLGAAGVRVIGQGCVDGTLKPSPAAKLRLVNDPRAPLGKGAVGWTSRTTGFETGPTVHVDSPSTLSRLRMSVLRQKGALSGHVIVRFKPAGDTGEWRGIAELPSSRGPGWHDLDATNATYQWRHYTSAGAVDIVTFPSTLQAFVPSKGGDGDGAWVGFAFGCNAETFAVDALKVTAGDETTTIDFEMFGSNARLAAAGGSTKTITIVAGAAQPLKATLVDSQGKPLKGKLKVQRKELTKKSYRTVDSVSSSGSGTKVVIEPQRSSTYRVSYAGTATRAPDVSKAVKVLVRSNVRARLASSSVVRGRPFTISGKFYPGRSARVSLQRYGSGEWTTVKKLRTAKDGSYRVTQPTSRLGKSYWRILVPKGGGNLPGHSPSLRLVTKPKPQSTGGGNPTPTNPTPPPTNIPQPPPPPTGPQ